jgi:gamma-glutamyltranspeptidase/glutathione hydrolase
MRKSILLLLSLSITLGTYSQSLRAFDYTSVKQIHAAKGAVVSAHPLASEVGVQILRKGGNAVDAAIATQLVLAVVYPGAGNLGGGGFLVGRLASGKNITIDYREKAPAAAHRDMYLNANGEVQPNKSLNGHLAAGVPGTPAGLFQSLRYAKLPFATLVAPAIELAEKGFAITEREARSLNEDRPIFVAHNTRPTAFIIDRPWKRGDTLRQPELAQTLRRMQAKGKAGFYEGRTAELIVAEMKRGGGLITEEDLKNYEAKEREPVVFPYKGYEILTMPLPSSGGVLLPMMMKMIEDKPLKAYGFHSLQAIQLMTEVERLAYADRARYLGDPDFYKVPVKTLTSEAYIKERMRLYVPDKPGDSKLIGSGTIPAESEETTHLSVADQWGNAVAVTTTLNGGYGSKTVVGGAGFLLNNEMDDFSLKPGVPNMYGALGGEANAIVAGKRMLSSMTPTIVLKNGKPYIVAGTPGGTTITTSVFQTLVNLLEFELSVDDAVNKPKFHHQWLPDVIRIERSFPTETKEALRKMGYTLLEVGGIGRTEVIRIQNGKMEAVADHRGDDSAAGF